MRKTLIVTAIAAAVLAGPVSAQPLQVNYPGDASMDCPALAAEAGRMDQLMADANAQVSKANGTAQGAGLASTVAVEGMLRTGMLGRVPGAGMFANNMANAAKQRAAQVQAQAQETIQTATTRKALLAGLYSGKGCDAAPPAPPAASEASPAPTGA
ncbi:MULTISPECIES: hypothetical protein [unclassified Phenylobacterium]|uniref:hypothetical protein n=1 Tax=unclassified Phenylobacterium TaxID=2640670 RepID=UPI00083ADE83|nr:MULTISPECIES: hypothetical protein [unclassified Phenylobacterium]